MTKTQVKKLLTSNGYSLEGFEIKTGEVEMLPVYDEDGDLDYDATEKKAEKISKLLPWGGYKCGYGGWVFQKGYTSSNLDYCDTAHPCHY